MHDKKLLNRKCYSFQVCSELEMLNQTAVGVMAVYLCEKDAPLDVWLDAIGEQGFDGGGDGLLVDRHPHSTPLLARTRRGEQPYQKSAAR